MPREREGFRDQLESIIAFHPAGELMTPQSVADYTGFERYVVTRRFPFIGSRGGKRISRTMLARELCGGDRRV